MKKYIILILIAILLIIAYFIWNDNEETFLPESENVTEITFDGFDGVEASFAPIEAPDIDPPNLYRKVTGITGISANRLDAVILSLEENSLDPDAWIEIGGLWYVGGAFNAAIEAWEYAHALSPLDEIALINLGNIYATNIGDLKIAESWYKKALEVAPQYVPVYFSMAEMYLYKMNDRKKAIAIVKQGLKELPLDGSLKSLKEVLESGGSI